MSTETAPSPPRPDDPARPSFGVEEEFLLVDSETGQPSLCNDAVVAAAERSGLDLQLELSQCQVETNSPVCWDTGTLRDHLLSSRSQVAAAAHSEGCRLVAAGTPILGPWRIPISDAERYQRMADRFGVLTIEQAVCGCHVHVDVPDRELAVQVCNHVRPWLPTLLALGANSALHRGADSGYSSWRSVVWSRWPTSGPPPLFRSAEHYDRMVDTLVDSGLLMDERMVYWDIRPSCHLPTVEIRIADVQPTVDEAILLATLIRALVATSTRVVAAGAAAPDVDLETLRAATWIAARDGLAGRAIDPRTATPSAPLPMIDALIAHVRDSLDEFGEYPRIDRLVRRQLATGNGAQWQRRTWHECGTLEAVVERSAQRTLQGAPHLD
ncbi:carboxylate-amine ligase [Rhodococcus sp. NPDC003348]